MWDWLKKHICFHQYEHIETYPIHNIKTEPPYFLSSYRCKKCGKVKNKCIYA